MNEGRHIIPYPHTPQTLPKLDPFLSEERDREREIVCVVCVCVCRQQPIINFLVLHTMQLHRPIRILQESHAGTTTPFFHLHYPSPARPPLPPLPCLHTYYMQYLLHRLTVSPPSPSFVCIKARVTSLREPRCVPSPHVAPLEWTMRHLHLVKRNPRRLLLTL